MKTWGAIGLLLLASATAALAEDLSELDLEALLDVRVISASKVEESVAEAPAMVLVLTRRDLERRGYRDLSQMLDDLPGMQMVRPYGATYFKNYWRGYRNTIGDPYLVLVDGAVQNHLYFETADILTVLPLSNIERVEVVYGPASSVYGPNAFVGVINVLTRREPEADGSVVEARLAGGEDETRLADVQALWKSGRFRLAASGRIDDGELEPGPNERYEYTKNRYYADRDLWGGFIDNPALGGRFSSPHRHRALDLRLSIGSAELGLNYYRLETGYGLEYSADRAQNHAVWSRPELSLHFRSTRELAPNLTAATFVRYRESDVANDSYFVAAASDTPRTVDFSYWQSLNSSWTVTQDLDWKASDQLGVNAGIEWERKDLQKAYDLAYGPALPPAAIDASTYPYPEPPADHRRAPNRIETEDIGAFLQLRYRLSPAHRFHLGLRSDHNSVYGGANTVRAGWVGQWGAYSVKALYGEAFQEPNPRLLYGGWTGSGSDPELDPERGKTIELGASRIGPKVVQHLSVYRTEYRDTIVNTASGAMNLGDREVLGLDYVLRAKLALAHVDDAEIYGSYTHLFTADEAKIAADGSSLGEGRIGDLARDQLQLGAVATFAGRFDVALRSRFVGARRTVETNPVDRIGSYVTADLTLSARELLPGVGLQIDATNLFDRAYDHPGVREASAGTDPGEFDAAGNWHGSGGFYNSLLPQPGRSIVASLRLRY